VSFRNNFASENSNVARHIFRGVLSLLFWLFAAFCFFHVGNWLVVEDPLEHARAIVVLSGRMPIRVLEAAKLYNAGYAPEVWLTRSSEPAKSLTSMGVEFYGEEYYNAKILVHQGVPPTAIRVLEPPIVNTADEINTIKSALNAAPSFGTSGAPNVASNDRALHTVIIVTTKPHTRRVRALWRLLAPHDGEAVIRASSFDPYDPHRWYRTTRDALDVVREVLGLLNAWAGLPLAP
jgi:uncharacterized SAM-binding protein YcdF (DUF218 family)